MKKVLLIVGFALISQLAIWGIAQKLIKVYFAWRYPSLNEIITKDQNFYAARC